jgi:hypothetical protein
MRKIGGWLVTGLVVAAIGMLPVVKVLLAVAADASQDHPAWAAPEVTALKKASDIWGAQQEPNLLNNLNCMPLTYRVPSGTDMLSGCFSQTAFGMLDSDSETGIFNGSSEGVPLIPYVSQEIIVPWPNALVVVALDSVPTGGSLVSLYRNPLSYLKDRRDITGRLTAKVFQDPPDLPLYDGAGNRLVINPQTLAFSDSGSWMVAETVTGAFLRINLATLDRVAITTAFGSQGSPGFLKSQVAITNSGNFVAIQNADNSSLQIYDLEHCPTNPCSNHDYWPFLKSHLDGLQKLRHLRFSSEGLLSFEAISSVSTLSGTYVIAPTANIGALTGYIGLGDSYASGEGAYDYRSGTDTDSNNCHLSTHSYPLLLTRDVFTQQGGHSVACSGARAPDIGNLDKSYTGQVRNGFSWDTLQASQAQLMSSVQANYLPGYIAQHWFVQKYQPSALTLMIGGNDIGFGDIIERCVTPHISPHLSDNTCFNTYEDRLELTNLIDRTVPKWTALFRQIQSEAPFSTVFVIGYPLILSDAGNCGLNVHLNQSERAFSIELAHYLNTAIEQAAGKAGVQFVNVEDALYGHRLCETASSGVAVNGLTAGNDIKILGIGILGRESYHPNALGQVLLEQAILKRTDNLRLRSSNHTTPVLNNIALLGNAPRTGRTIMNIQPDKVLPSGIVQKGTSVQITAKGPPNGLAPNTPVSIRIDNSREIATTTTSATSDVSTSVNFPSDLTSGGHSIDIISTGSGGNIIDITQPFYTPDSSTDTDGDDIADTVDSCPYALNSGLDSDGDQVDDACDSTVAPLGSNQPPAGQSGAGTINQHDTPSGISSARSSALGRSTTLPQSSQAKSTLHEQQALLGASAPKQNPAVRHTPLLRLSLLYIGLIWLLMFFCLVSGRQLRQQIRKQRYALIYSI